VARGWRSMMTARPPSGSPPACWPVPGRAGRPARTPPARPPRRPVVASRIAAPMPSRSHNRSCVHAPPNQREATISTSPAPGRGRGLLRGHYREIDATSRASAARSTWSAPSCGSPWRRSSRSAGVHPVEYAGSSPAQDSQLPRGTARRALSGGQPGAGRAHRHQARRDRRGIVPAVPDLPPFTLAEGPQGDVECRLHRANLW
jgi:hypothetical protein